MTHFAVGQLSQSNQTLEYPPENREPVVRNPPGVALPVELGLLAGRAHRRGGQLLGVLTKRTQFGGRLPSELTENLLDIISPTKESFICATNSAFDGAI